MQHTPKHRIHSPKFKYFAMSDPDVECVPQAPSSSQPTKKSRLWLFTLYGENLGGESIPWVPTKMTYMTFQLEKCPTTQRLHLQGVLRMKDVTTMATVKRVLEHPTIHLVATNNLEHGIKYCNKERTKVSGPWTHGSVPQQGARSDLATIATQVLAGKRPRELAAEDPVTYIRYHKGLQALAAAAQPARTHPNRRCALLIGPTGCGKTRMAYDLFPERDVFIVPDIKNPWFDGYEQEKVVILDECGPDMMHYNYLKRLTHRYPLWVPNKGSMLPWNAEIIILTAQQPLHTWWGDKLTQSDADALLRRIKVFHMPHDKAKAEEWILHGTDPDPPATWGQIRPAPTVVDIFDVED